MRIVEMEVHYKTRLIENLRIKLSTKMKLQQIV